MRVTMVKKQFQNGQTCQKCAQAEELLRRRGLWELIDTVEWAVEGDPSSPGMKRAAEHDVALAPFFVVETEADTRVYSSVLKLINEVLEPERAVARGSQGDAEPELLERELEGATPQEIVARALGLFGGDCVIAFSGAEDVALIDLAKRTGHPFRVLTLDTGRLHPETYRFLDRVREHFGIQIDVMFPDSVRIEELVRNKGLFSFYTDGHGECCQIRKVLPLRRGLLGARAWMTGQRRDQSPTRTDVRIVSRDLSHASSQGHLVKWNPLAAWSLTEVWSYIRENELPYNPLHDRGFVSIGCEPCTRAIRPGEHERAGRWWWEEATQRECGLHLPSGVSKDAARAPEAATPTPK